MGLVYTPSKRLWARQLDGSFAPVVTLDGGKTFDDTLSETSENAPQTKAVNAAFEVVNMKLQELEDSIGTGGSGGTSSDVPVASDSVAGKVKIGSGLDVAEDGTISVNENSIVTIMENNTHEFTEQEIKDAFDQAQADDADTNDDVV